MRNILHVEADIKGQRRVPAYTVTQNDSVSIVVSVLDGGSPVNLDEVSTMTIACTRRDGAVVVKDGTQTGPNEVTFDLGTTEIEQTGKVDAVIQLYSADGRVSTIKFSFMVTKDPTGDGYVPSEEERTLIEVVLGDGPLTIERAEMAAASAEGATAYIDEKKPLIDKFTDEQTNLQAQLDEVARGATNAETSQARVSTTGTAYGTLKQRLDTEYEEVTTQLAQKPNKEEVRYRTEKIGENDLTTDLLSSMTGETTLNLLSLSPQHSVEPMTTTFLKQGKNIINKDSFIPGYLVSPTGDLATSETNSVTPFISVKPNQSYASNYNSSCRVGFYTSSRQFIGRLDLTTHGKVFTTPENCGYIRVSIGNGYVPNLDIREGTEPATIKEDYFIEMDKLNLHENQLKQVEIRTKRIFEPKISNEYTRFFEHGKNLVNTAVMTNGFRVISSTGELVADTSYKVTPYIEIEASSTYSMSSNAASIAFYGENGKYISGIASGTGTSFVTPSNARYIRLSLVTGHVNFQLEKGSDSTPIEDFYIESDSLLLKKENFQDNTIPLSALQGDVSGSYKPKKYPLPAQVEPEFNRPNNASFHVTCVEQDYIWATFFNNTILKSADGENFELVVDVSPFLIQDETISQYALIISDTGRIIVATNKGRVLVSDEAQTTFTEAFTFKVGYAYVTRGYDKKGKYILMSSYGTKGTMNPPREVYLSKDHGETWELIFDKPIEKMIDPEDYHVHDVAFDPYSNMIILSIGDGANRQIHYSYDFGKTWYDVFDESKYDLENWPPLHPTDIQVFPEGIAFGSDEVPEGISWWNRPENIIEPEVKWEDIEYKVIFGDPNAPNIGTYAMNGDTLQTDKGFFGVMPFRDHQTYIEGHPRLFATGDGGRSWHQIYKQEEWTSERMGFLNALLKEEVDGIYIYSIYSQYGTTSIFKAKMPEFHEL